MDTTDADPPVSGDGLDEQARQILAFERRWWQRPGAKANAVHTEFGLSPTRYHQILNTLLDDPRAHAHDPLLVGRLRRLRDRVTARRRRPGSSTDTRPL